ncbi:MAG: VOC family protein [Pseudomonadota bacterium]
MAVVALGYIGVRSDLLEDWSDFAERLLGMQRVDYSKKSAAFRMDDQAQRLLVSDEPGDTLSFIGFEVDDVADLDKYAGRLEQHGVPVTRGDRALCDQRLVGDLICFEDPNGNRIELFHAPVITSDPFQPGRPIEGFKTGSLGMGHAVLHVSDVETMMKFYRDTLDFAVSDYGLQPYGLYFFHLNARHHSFALVGSGEQGFHHFMVEFNNIDDVGQGYDLAEMDEDRIAYTLGRHSNDYILSYYAKTPSGFFVESGWGGRLIDPGSWEPHETHGGPSFWGHERLHLPEGGTRERLRDMRFQMAADGRRSPAHLDCPWVYSELPPQTRSR